MHTAYIIDAVRTPIGKYGGTLATVRPDDLLAHTIKALLARNPDVPQEAIEDVIAGCANQAGEDNRNVARMAALLAGLPDSVGGNTVNRLCASGLQAIMDASRAVQCGDGEIYIAAGVESMSRAPFVMSKAENAWQRKVEVFDTTLGWRFINDKLSELHYPYSMGETAENVAERHQVSREAQDAFAVQSQQRYADAAAAGRFADEIVPVTVDLGKGKTREFTTDEHPRLSPPEKLAELKAAFKKGGSVTAGNSSGVNDGAAALIIASEEAVKKYNLKPIAKVIASAIAGVDPAVMGLGPIPATKKALQRAGLQAADLDLVELNEAFASQGLAVLRDLGIADDDPRVNPNGGAIALGHPLGMSGARLATTATYQLQRSGGRYALCTMCIGVGQGISLVLERV
jgi:3-oxoadipyl-CoA thiolase